MEQIGSPLGLALVAAAVSFLGLVISKESKVSELRQNWIDSLREELSQLIGHIWELHYKVSGDLKEIDFEKLHAPGASVSRLATKIRLRLNPKEPESKDVLACIDEMPGMTSKRTVALTQYSEVHKSTAELTRLSAVLLKKEWDRVKRGEQFFFVTKWALVLLLVVGGISASQGLAFGEL